MITPKEYLQYQHEHKREIMYQELIRNKYITKKKQKEIKKIQEYIDYELKHDRTDIWLHLFEYSFVDSDDIEAIANQYREIGWNCEWSTSSFEGRCKIMLDFSINHDKNTQVVQLESELSEHKPE